MIMTNVWMNLEGTTNTSFAIGKNGVTIYQGSTTPDGSIGKNGDVFILGGSSPNLLQKTSGNWISTSAPERIFLGQEVVYGGTITPTIYTTYVGVNTQPSVMVTTLIILPTTGVTNGHQIIVKDEANCAGTYQITIGTDNGSMIDGQSNQFITGNSGALRLMFLNGLWRVSGSVY